MTGKIKAEHADKLIAIKKALFDPRGQDPSSSGRRRIEGSMTKQGSFIVIARTEECVSADLDGEAVVLDLASGVYFGIKGIGTRVWELAQEPCSVEEMLTMIVAEHQVEREVAERDLLGFLQQLADRGLVKLQDAQDR